MIERFSPCKVNFLLNVLGKRADGFHEVETLMHPVPIGDSIVFEKRGGSGVALSCSIAELPVDETNLVHRAAKLFFEATGIRDGVRIHLEKRVPLAAGLGGGSSNAGCTLLALNDLFEQPLSSTALNEVAARLGSDVPFFLQKNPALAFGRGEDVRPVAPFACLNGVTIVLIHPGFGISTPWAYQQLERFPDVRNGCAGRATRLAGDLRNGGLGVAASQFYNSLEAPALRKFPILSLYQTLFRDAGANATLMSGSGSATFALFESATLSDRALELYRSEFGETSWIRAAAFGGGGGAVA